MIYPNKIKLINNKMKANYNKLINKKKKQTHHKVAFNYKMKFQKMDLTLMIMKDYNIKMRKKLNRILLIIHKVGKCFIKMNTPLKF